MKRLFSLLCVVLLCMALAIQVSAAQLPRLVDGADLLSEYQEAELLEELDRVIDRAGKMLSQISDYPVFTASTAVDRVTVKRFDLLMVEENAFIVVVMVLIALNLARKYVHKMFNQSVKKTLRTEKGGSKS